jgi:hypothetical protein
MSRTRKFFVALVYTTLMAAGIFFVYTRTGFAEFGEQVRCRSMLARYYVEGTTPRPGDPEYARYLKCYYLICGTGIRSQSAASTQTP